MWRLAKDVLVVNLDSQILKISHGRISELKKRLIVNLMAQDIENLNDQEIVSVIRKFLERARLKKKPAVISLVSSNVCVTKNIAIPSLNPQEIKEIINLQASRYSPYSREEIIIDYLDIGRHHEKYTKILLVLANRNAIRRQFSILNRAGLEISRVAFKPEALGNLASRSLHLEQEKEPVGILHLDKTTSDFTILLRGKVIFSRNISLGTQALAEKKDEFLQKIRTEVGKSLDSYRAEEIDLAPNNFS